MLSDHQQSQWHPGEAEMHRLLAVPVRDNPTLKGLPAAYGQWMAQSTLLALGTVDQADRIWTTVLGGQAGGTLPIAPGMLGVRTSAYSEGRSGTGDAGVGRFDPVLEELLRGARGGTIDHGVGKMVSGLALNLEERGRIKLAGRVVRGVLAADDAQSSRSRPNQLARLDVKLAVAVDETLGNCPKYLNRKTIWPHSASPQLDSDLLPLTHKALELIGKADMIFLTSRHGTASMDTNIRGGAPGFVRVFSNSHAEGVNLVYPEYSGNRLYQTLGNLKADPAVGITFVDFASSNVLYTTGQAKILVGADAYAVLPRSPLAVMVTLEAARFVSDGLSFRGRQLDDSPYNPPVRRLAREIQETDGPSLTLDWDNSTRGVATATLIHSDPITPTVSRYTFRLSPGLSSDRGDDEFRRLTPWRAGLQETNGPWPLS